MTTASYARLRRWWLRRFRPLALYCRCPDCIRCGCGMWERHHNDVREVV